MALAQNPDLSLGMKRPGVYVAVNLNAPGGGVNNIARRLLVLAYKTSAGIAPPNKPFLCTSDSDAINGCGMQSDARRGFARALTQIGAGAADIWICPLLEPSGGTASTYEITLEGTATTPGVVDVSVDGQSIISVGYSVGDAAADIAANVEVAINQLANAPVTAGVSGAVITLTYVHKGAVGEDLPIRAQATSGSGITFSAGTLTFTGTATAAGSAEIVICGTTIVVPITDTMTAAAAATATAAAINAADYPIVAVANSTAVDLQYAPGRDIRRITASLVTVTGLTVALSAAGTVGVGAPSLTTALTNLSALLGFGQWVHPFVGTQIIPDVTTAGTLSQYIETQANGVNQQEENVHAAAAWPMSVLGSIPTGSSPALTASPRYAELWCQDAGIQAFELACKLAAARAANDYPPKNWDGYVLVGSAQWPLILPAQSSRPDSGDINAAMVNYYLTPLRVDEANGVLVVESAKTTSSSTYLPLRDFATIDQIAYWRPSLAGRLAQRFGAVDAKQVGTPRTPNTITAQSVADEAYLLAEEWDAQDVYDGAANFKAGFQSQFNAQDPTRIDLVFPMSPVINVHQISALGSLVAPTAASSS